MRNLARHAAVRVLAAPAVRDRVLRRAGRRGLGMALLWHRVAAGGPQPHEVVRTVDVDRFRRHVEVLGELGDIVPLAELEQPDDRHRPRFALTFDDDYACYAEHVLPVLRDLRVPATFFLSGRCLADLGPYWWEVLEVEIAAEGADAVARRLGIAGAGPLRIAAAVEGTAEADRLAGLGEAQPPSGLDHAGIEALKHAGMEIGFHTLRHPVMPLLDDNALARAATEGLAELRAATGQPVERFAYPHGRADARSAGAARRAGFRTAWTTTGAPTTSADRPHLEPRWEPGDRPVDEVVALVVRRLAAGPRASAGAASAAPAAG